MNLILIFSLLIFGDQISPGSSKCISEDQFNNRVGKLRSYWDKLNASGAAMQQLDAQTCEQAAREMAGDLKDRSLSPWRYRLDQDTDRFPPEIAFAECLCQGCVINKREEMSYNSVPVFAPLIVLRKTLCQQDPSKYQVKKEFIKIPVACICALPKYAE